MTDVSEEAAAGSGSGRGGAGPSPFRQFIVKVHGRCNLACRYCYLYEGPDHTWRGRPAAAPDAVLDRTADRIAEHARSHGLTAVSLVLHGGEPLLAGAGTLARFTGLVRERVPVGCTVHATVQTNATLLTEERMTTLARHGIRVGISLDGGLAAHNARRVDHAGRPSWPAASRGARLVADRFPDAYAGILTVVDPTLDPVETYESLLALRPPALDLLLPHGNWSAPPPRLEATRYGDWLCAVFDRWWRSGRREVRVRLFEECIALLLGLPAATESLGLAPFDAVVVETDGSIEQVDSLKSAYEGAAETGLDVFRHGFDDALRHPGVAARQAGVAALSAQCRACPLLDVCGGGHYAHRYRAGQGFTNPSVYCADLQRFIRHVHRRLTGAATTAPVPAPVVSTSEERPPPVLFPSLPDRSLEALGRTEGDPETLALLVRDQDTRRLLMLRALLDAAEGADTAVLPAGARARLREDWQLLETADRVLPAGDRGNPSPPYATTPARARLLDPLVGLWVRHCLSGLGPEAGPPTERRVRELGHDLGHLGTLAAAAAARAGISFTVRLTARDGVLVLPSLGSLRTAGPGEVPVDVDCADGRLTLRQTGAAAVVVQMEDGIGAWSAAPGWTPAYALPGLLPDGPPLPLDDLDPYRTVRGDPRHHELSGPTALDETARKRWLEAWSGTADMLRLGGEHRVTEAVVLLRCLVPLAEPPRPDPDTTDTGGTGSCSGTRREAFGALFSSAPPTPATFAATIVHELQHTKLCVLSDMLDLHHAGPQRRHFAPWRPDPRPYDGLLQGVYSHLALADFFQRCALRAEHPGHRETAWSEHARYRAQVAAALPALVGSPELTAPGRRFVDQLVATHERLAEFPAPRGHTARAEASVNEARDLWTRRHGPAVRYPQE